MVGERWADSRMFGGQSTQGLLAKNRRRGVEAPCQLLTTRRMGREKSLHLAAWVTDAQVERTVQMCSYGAPRKGSGY